MQLGRIEPLEGVARHEGHPARLQRDGVGRAGCAAQQRAFAGPTAG